MRYGAPMAAVTMPAGSANGSTARATRSARDDEDAAQTIEASTGGREPPIRRSAICGTTKATNSSGPTAATATDERADGDDQDAELGDLQAHAEPAGRVVAEQHRVQRADQQQGSGRRDQQRQHDRPDVLPAARGERAAQPHLRAGGVLDAGVDQQVRRAGGQRRAQADADQHQPLDVEAASPGEDVEQQRRSPAPPRRPRAARRAPAADPVTSPPPYPLAPETTITATAAERRAVGDAEDVGAGQRVAGQRSG